MSSWASCKANDDYIMGVIDFGCANEGPNRSSGRWKAGRITVPPGLQIPAVSKRSFEAGDETFIETPGEHRKMSEGFEKCDSVTNFGSNKASVSSS